MRALLNPILLVSFAALSAAGVQARPISWPGGTMAMVDHDSDMTEAMLTYTWDRQFGGGYSFLADREDDWQAHGLHLNWLLKRWNFPDAQANLYVLGTAGIVEGVEGLFADETEPFGMIGFQADVEDRRLYAAYEARFIEAGDFERAFEQTMRLGVAPYVGDYGDLHTWLIVQAMHKPEGDDPLSGAILVRLFQGNVLGEVGVDDGGEVILNLTLQF